MTVVQLGKAPRGLSLSRVMMLLGGVGVLLVVLTILMGTWYTIDQGERAVLLRNGAFVGVEGPGLHFKPSAMPQADRRVLRPWFEAVRTISVQTQTLQYDKVNSYSQDQQPADVRISATFHADPAGVDTLYARFGSLDAATSRVIEPHVLQELKVVFGRYTAARAIQERAKLNADVFTAIKDSMAGNPELVLESVQIENIDFSPQYVASIEARMQAEIDVQKIQQQYQQQEVRAKITVVNAQAEADARLATAKAEAQSIQLRGDAEAQAIKARGDALKQNPDLVSLTAAERWNGVLPTTMVPGGSVPFVGVK